jgi:hypothetical protein
VAPKNASILGAIVLVQYHVNYHHLPRQARDTRQGDDLDKKEAFPHRQGGSGGKGGNKCTQFNVSVMTSDSVWCEKLLFCAVLY